MTSRSPSSQLRSASNGRARTTAQFGLPLLPWYRARNPARVVNLATFIVLVGSTACNGGNAEGARSDFVHVDAVEPAIAAGQNGSALQIRKASGAVLAHPVLRLATFNNDPAAADLNDFAVKLAASRYWATATGEYGVGALSAAASQAFIFAWPTSTTDGDLNAGQSSNVETFLAAQLDDASALAWGSPDPSSIYVLMLPSGLQVSPDGGSIASACDANILAWHTAMTLPQSGVTVPYVVVPNCGPRGPLTELESRTLALSHALVEAATNPLLDAYNSVDANHIAWQLASGSPEVASACVAALGSSSALWTQPADLPFVVQRTWSNAAAAAGEPPCVPSAAGEVAIDAAPAPSTIVRAAISTNPSVPPINTLGVQIGVGGTGTVPLHLHSSAPTAPWKVTATEMGSQVLQLSIDKPSGSDGDTLQLTIKVTATNGVSAQELVRVTSTLGSQISYDYLLVHN